MPQNRFYSSTTRRTTTTADPGTSGTTLTVADSTVFASLDGKFPYALAINTDGTDREIVYVTARPTSTTLTVTRGRDGTTGQAHAVGATVDHVAIAADLNELSAHMATSWVNVMDQGVKGDGSTDDTTAIQAVINAMPSTGGTIYFPPGTYKLSAALALKSNLVLIGAGQAASILQQTTTTAACLSGVDVNTLTIERMQLQGPASGTGTGITLTRSAQANCRYISLRDLYIRQFGQDGVAISNCIVSHFARVNCENNGRHGFFLFGVTGGAAGTSVALDACYANTNTTTGFNLFNMVYTALSGCASEGHPTNYLIDTCQGVSLSGCGSEAMASGGTGFKITGGFCNTLTSCWDLTNRGKAFWVTGSSFANNLAGIVENTPGVGATASLQVDAGCTGINLHTISNTTALSLATGTTNILNDGANGTVTHGYAFYDGGFEVNHDALFDQGVDVWGSLRLHSPGNAYFAVSGLRYETISRRDIAASITMTSGTLYMMGIGLPKGVTLNNIYVAFGTAESGGTHAWAALFNSSRVMLARSADNTGATFITANTVKTFPIAQLAGGAGTSFTTTYDGEHYIGVMVTASTTMPTLRGVTALVGFVDAGMGAVALCGPSSTGQTTPPAFPFTAAALTATATEFYAGVG